MEKIIIRRLEEVPPLSISLQPTLWNKTGTWRYLRPVYSNEKIAPCIHGCPISQNIPAWLGLVAEERFEEALGVLMMDNPFPGICGRVCHHPCESVCNRKDYDEGVSIHMIERFLGDLRKTRSTPMRRPRTEGGKRVAIIGSGPAGLSCAYHLVRAGHRVKVFEALPELGGMLRVIPPYRLPRAALDRELSWIQELGVECQVNTRIDREVIEKDFSEFDATFIATGATVEQRLSIPGENLEGVLRGVEFLRLSRAMAKADMGKRVVIVGGGNTAIDAARTLWRMGREPVVLYRRTREQMPAIADEVEEALREGVKIEYLVSPLRIVGREGRVAGVECVRNRLASPDRGGRPKPDPIPGSQFSMDADAVVLALGAVPDADLMKGWLEMDEDGIRVDAWGKTSGGGVFAGGDVASGLGTVSDAVGSGKRAALAIDHVLTEGALPADPWPRQIVEIQDMNLDYFSHSRRAKTPKLSIEKRAHTPGEVNRGMSRTMAVRESHRCFSCGFCNHCNICLMVCPDVAISQKDEDLSIDYDYCKGCGICAEECPRSVIQLEREELWRR